MCLAWPANSSYRCSRISPNVLIAARHFISVGTGAQYSIERSRRHKSNLVVKFVGIDSANSAQSLVSMEAFVPGVESVDLDPGHYLLADLIGIAVNTADGVPLGSVTEVLRTGSNDVYVVGTGRQSVLIPGIQDAIVELDVPGRRMIVAPWVAAPAV